MATEQTLNEFDVIHRFFNKAASKASIIQGIGDDCALLKIPDNQTLAMSIDTLVAGVHFPKDAAPEDIGTRALCVALSDLAAMGARPLWFTLALTLPQAKEAWLERFSRGLFSVAKKHDCELVGGDTTRGPLAVTIQVHGTVSGRGLLRSGASVGDAVFLTGDLGDGAAALWAMAHKDEIAKLDFQYLVKRFYSPTPKINEGDMLASMASAAIDVSDGLLADLNHICRASGVAAEIDLEAIPFSNAVLRNSSMAQRQQWALSGGDDYQLCFTVPGVAETQVNYFVKTHKLRAQRIGRIVSKSLAADDTRDNRVTCLYRGKPVSVERLGYQHF